MNANMNVRMTDRDIEHDRHLSTLADELNDKFGHRVVTIDTYPGYDTTKRLGEASFCVWFEEYGNHDDTGVTWCLPKSDYFTQRNILYMMIKLSNNPVQDGKTLGWPASLRIR